MEANRSVTVAVAFCLDYNAIVINSSVADANISLQSVNTNTSIVYQQLNMTLLTYSLLTNDNITKALGPSPEKAFDAPHPHDRLSIMRVGFCILPHPIFFSDGEE